VRKTMSSIFVAEKATAPVISAETNQFISTKLEKRDYFVDAPNVISNAHFHCWRHAQSLVNPAKIIVHVMKRNGVLQIFALLLLLVFLLPLPLCNGSLANRPSFRGCEQYVTCIWRAVKNGS